MSIKSYKSPKHNTMIVQGGHGNHVGILQPLGLISSRISAGTSNIIAVYNSDNQTKFVRTGDNTVVIGTDYVDNIAIPPMSYIYVNMGADQYIIGSAGVYAYLVIDEANPSIE